MAGPMARVGGFMLGLCFLSKRRALSRAVARRVTSRVLGMCLASSALGNAADSAPGAASTGSYQAPATCPSRDEFLREVLARTSPEAQSVGRSIAQQASIAIHTDASIVRGKLWSAGVEPREVVGATCAEVVQALALVVALQAKRAVQSPGIEGLSASETTPQSLEPTFANESNRAAAEPTVQLPPAHPARERSHTAAPPTLVEGASLRLMAGPMRLRQASRTRTARWIWGGGAIAAFGTAPVSLYGVSLFVEHQPVSRLPFSLAIGTELTPRRTYKIQEESAAFQWLGSRANVCVRALALAERSGLWLCAEVVGGLTIATGRSSDQITQARTAYEAWFSSGSATRLRFGLPAALVLDLAAGLHFPFIRHSTKFSNPDIPVHDTGDLAGFMFLQLGYGSAGSDPRAAAIAK